MPVNAYPGGKAATAWNYSSPINVEIKNAWNFPFTLPFALTVWGLIKHKDNLYSSCPYEHINTN